MPRHQLPRPVFGRLQYQEVCLQSDHRDHDVGDEDDDDDDDGNDEENDNDDEDDDDDDDDDDYQQKQIELKEGRRYRRCILLKGL